MTGAQYRLTGRINVPLPPDEAFVLFTPRGEEAWVQGWNPRFPTDPEDDTLPGTVFETSHNSTTWLVIDCDPGRRISYARFTPADRVGTVTVAILDGGQVEVTYELTALNPDADAALREFAAGYPAFLKSWEEAIGVTHRPDSPM